LSTSSGDLVEFQAVAQLHDGSLVCKYRNEAGGWTYISNRIAGGVVIVNTALLTVDDIQAALVDIQAEEDRGALAAADAAMEQLLHGEWDWFLEDGGSDDG
jgi:hypothetical protein